MEGDKELIPLSSAPRFASPRVAPASPVSRTARRVLLRMRTSFPSALPTIRSHGDPRGGQQVPRALCPTHRYRSDVWFTGSTECSGFSAKIVGVCSLASDASPWSTQFPFFSGALALYLRHRSQDAVGMKQQQPPPLSGRSFRWHLAFTPPLDCRSGM